MAQFDTKTFLELSGKGTGPVQALGTAFGMPSCLVNLGAEALAILPTPLLNGIRGSAANGANRADDVIKALSAKLRSITGIIEYDTEDGTFRFVSDSSKNGLDRNEGGLLNSLGGFLGAVGAAAGFAGRLYNNYQTTQAQINGIKDCIKSYTDYLSYTGGAAGDRKSELAYQDLDAYNRMLEEQYGTDKQDLLDALRFKLDALTLVQNIDRQIAARLSNPTLEPEFLSDYAEFVSGTSLKLEQPSSTPIVTELFRLDYGPPVSKRGKFILSVDGLYYDSQTSGIVPALLELESRKSSIPSNLQWKLDFDPNLGGRGLPTTVDDLTYYFNTILDPNILDDSDFLQNYYINDTLLTDLIGQKNRRIYDTSTQLSQLEADGESAIILANLRQVMLSETSHYLVKINKRKKQIELAVKVPVIYGKGTLYLPGEVPINDFSYLEGINLLLDISNQRTLTIDQTEVSGVVLPIEVKYVQQINNVDNLTISHLILNRIGLGSLVSDPSGGSQTIPLTTQIVDDNLIALYSYLSFELEDASSTRFHLKNSSYRGVVNNGQLVAQSPDYALGLGTGIVYLGGITKHSKTNPTVPSAIASYIRLPDSTDFQNLIYNKDGATIDTWIHVPELDGRLYGFNDDYDVSGLYRLILANENVGSQENVTRSYSITRMPKENGTDVTRGLIFGFTRDVRLTRDMDPTNVDAINEVRYACLVLAPTQSYDSSSAGFIRKPATPESCDSSGGWYCMRQSFWDDSSGVTISSIGREFCHLAVTLSPENDEIKFYLDGVNITTSSYREVFGTTSDEQTPNIPSFIKKNSFEYNSTFLEDTDVDELKYGPKLNKYFTPWILGGGYTDGNPNGNFMGGVYGGIISGLKGYLGSTKFYSKALTPEEILNNFNANKDFFKNIEVHNLMWEPILIN